MKNKNPHHLWQGFRLKLVVQSRHVSNPSNSTPAGVCGLARNTLSAQVVPDASAAAMLAQGAAFDQYPEMLFECVPAGSSQLDRFADGDAAMLPCEFDDLQRQFGQGSQHD